MKVTIYTKSNCPYCVRAKAFFAANEIEYSEITLDDDAARKTFLETVGQNVKTVPQIFLTEDGLQTRIGGYDDMIAKKDIVLQMLGKKMV